ncbi:hypothetical protein [Micromonospora halophytica]|uniref:hypothetical protein n=1 Tax=Micromonospora TaxID=1873 RepID=UPI001112C8D6|nr:hypothetical protein [Micromonospora halophytica]
MARSPRTPQQTGVAITARSLHRVWLADRGIREMEGWLHEESFTAILLAALLDPDTCDVITDLLLAETPSKTLRDRGPLTLHSAPKPVMDLVLGFGGLERAAIVIEAKRFYSPSNWCLSARGEWLPQTDVAVEDANEPDPPGWLWGIQAGQVHDFVLLDPFSRPVSTLFPNGRHNHRWRTVGYSELGVGLRTAHDRGVRGLTPLIASLWADSDHQF